MDALVAWFSKLSSVGRTHNIHIEAVMERLEAMVEDYAVRKAVSQQQYFDPWELQLQRISRERLSELEGEFGRER